MIPNVQNIIQAAVRNKRRLSLRYDGRSHARIVEPHLLFRSDQDVITMLAYQVRGYHSSKRRGSFWRPFQIRKIDSISVTDELFTPRMKEGYIKVCDMIQGTALVRVDGADTYMHFNPAIYGPPTPAYLAASPSMLLHMLAASNAEKTANETGSETGVG